MLHYHIAVQGPNNRAAILRAIRSTASAAKFTHVTGLFAYATLVGAKLLIEILSAALPNWTKIKKRWLISIDFGRTEPEALRLLQRLGSSEVRVPYGKEVMERNLHPFVPFHAKTLLLHFEKGPFLGPVGLVVGSANLTLSGLSIGHEHAIAATSRIPVGKKETEILATILKDCVYFDELFARSNRVNDSFLKRYEELRQSIKPTPEDENPHVVRIMQATAELTLSQAVALGTGKNLWVDVDYVVANRGPGLPGNQVDLPRGTRVFFGLSGESVPRNTFLGTVEIECRGNVVECHMRFGNNQMDKLNLPIPGSEGPPNYVHETLLFGREPDEKYSLNIGSANQIKKWKSISKSQGTFYRMQGGREYGVFT